MSPRLISIICTPKELQEMMPNSLCQFRHWEVILCCRWWWRWYNSLNKFFLSITRVLFYLTSEGSAILLYCFPSWVDKHEPGLHAAQCNEGVSHHELEGQKADFSTTISDQHLPPSLNRQCIILWWSFQYSGNCPRAIKGYGDVPWTLHVTKRKPSRSDNMALCRTLTLPFLFPHALFHLQSPGLFSVPDSLPYF